MENKKMYSTERLKYDKPIAEGMMPPQAVELEEAVLGALMLEKITLFEVSSMLSPKIFYKEEHQKICTAILHLLEKDAGVNQLTVIERLRKSGDIDSVGGAYYIATLTNRVATTADVEYHIRILQEKYFLRELIRIGTQLAHRAYLNEEVFDLNGFVYDELGKAEAVIHKGTTETMAKTLHDTIAEIERASKTDNGISGLTTGLTDFDILLGGLFSELIIIASRPSMGKSALMCSLLKNMAIDRKIPIACFSSEMSRRQIMRRILSNVTEIDGETLKHGTLTSSQWDTLVLETSHIEDSPLYIDDTPNINYRELIIRSKRLKAKHDIKCVMIDYLQLLSLPEQDVKGNSRDIQVGMISKALKGLVRVIDAPVILLAQLSRAVDQNKNKVPTLSDLRESGNIEQDADVVIFPYRPEYYGYQKNGRDNSDTNETCELIVAKNRDGKVYINDPIRTRCELHIQRFSDYVGNYPGKPSRPEPKIDLPF